MAVRLISVAPKKAVNWYTPVHRLFAIGKGEAKFYASRGPAPSFLIEGDTQSEVEREAGMQINAFAIRKGQAERD
jgi:hypothetical protein